MPTITYRETKYCNAVRDCIAQLGHATNATILDQLRAQYPNVSATTVHRVTARLYGRGEVALAPPDQYGSMRYDANTEPHDHFLCSSCSLLRDTDVKEEIIPILEASIGDCKISGQLTISGICKQCIEVK